MSTIREHSTSSQSPRAPLSPAPHATARPHALSRRSLMAAITLSLLAFGALALQPGASAPLAAHAAPALADGPNTPCSGLMIGC